MNKSKALVYGFIVVVLSAIMIGAAIYLPSLMQSLHGG